ncbi:hypothetical protein EYZ11_004599 [Aspergillus tanneri]|uniref:Uncharacterized protein n=1 Tax=Aspergillus tanneri TaxID=1220188 RepID=A0A4S3JKC4_9EURO|nr:hypothetical protein EYZ11_004599 [Aspergillus tanneri]
MDAFNRHMPTENALSEAIQVAMNEMDTMPSDNEKTQT